MKRTGLVALCAALTLGAASAGSETLITPFAGAAFSGSTDRSRATYGGALGFLGGIAGFELEFATTPDFFGTTEDNDAFTQNSVVTLMGNLVLATPGPVRVYGTVGVGLLKTRLEDADRLFSIDSNDFGINAGGGVMFFFSDHVGLRGDIRYFRDLQDDKPNGEFNIDFGQVSYWRGVAGITFKF